MAIATDGALWFD